MLKVTRLPVVVDGFVWSLNAITGSLLKSNPSKFLSKQYAHIPSRVQNALSYCSNPFNLGPPNPHQIEKLSDSDGYKLLSYKANLEFLRNKWLILSLFYAGNQDFLFDKTEVAIKEISRLYNNSVGSDCLQKTLLVAKTSKSFFESGVIFIGANPPTGHMHSWIIEEGCQPDLLDRHWISYQPILAIHSA